MRPVSGVGAAFRAHRDEGARTIRGAAVVTMVNDLAMPVVSGHVAAQRRYWMALQKAELAHIAALARIRLDEAELEPLAAELSQILTWAAQLEEIDTSGVPPMTSVAAMRLPMREDIVTDGDCRDAILGNAPQEAKGFFAVPKVIE
jgi:aspartyl-tRNA(Asn)/glutamyl-tRNA(Gln) amidotransferase subunit C